MLNCFLAFTRYNKYVSQFLYLVANMTYYLGAAFMMFVVPGLLIRTTTESKFHKKQLNVYEPSAKKAR